ncbi:LysE family transporter [Micromonospora sp. NPDC049836]|uniref:LysE family transporter n=1 Tax=Micromonospora sp. NPDC049836 TaxID=3364274 RepID=UPI003792C128
MLGLSTATLAGYLAAIVVLMVTPGPDMMFVLANATRYGIGAGAVAALGVAPGETVHVAAVVAGLAAVISASPVLFTAIWWAGAAYSYRTGIKRDARPTRQPLVREDVLDIRLEVDPVDPPQANPVHEDAAWQLGVGAVGAATPWSAWLSNSDEALLFFRVA